MPKRITDIDRRIGPRIRRGRLAAGLSQTDIGEAIGVTFQMVQKLEKGNSRISAGNLAAIAQVIGKPVGWLYGDDAPPRLPSFAAHAGEPAVDQFFLDRDGFRIARSVYGDANLKSKVAALCLGLAQGESK